MSKTNYPSPSMIIKSSNWAQMSSFSLMPITNDCPYVEALYNPNAKTLAIIGKTKKDTFHMIPRLSDDGHPIRLKSVVSEDEPFKKQRVSQESYTEYYITEKSEIENFIQNIAVNHEEYDYAKILDIEMMSDALKPGAILPGPSLEKGKSKIILSSK